MNLRSIIIELFESSHFLLKYSDSNLDVKQLNKNDLVVLEKKKKKKKTEGKPFAIGNVGISELL